MFNYEMKVLREESMNFFMSYYEVNGALLEVVDWTVDILIND